MKTNLKKCITEQEQTRSNIESMIIDRIRRGLILEENDLRGIYSISNTLDVLNKLKDEPCEPVVTFLNPTH